MARTANSQLLSLWQIRFDAQGRLYVTSVDSNVYRIEDADFLPGGGYFTRIFAKAVGPKGTVYAVINPPAANATRPNAIIAVTAEPAYTNIKIVQGDFAWLTSMRQCVLLGSKASSTSTPRPWRLCRSW